MIDIFLYLLIVALAIYHWLDRQELVKTHNQVIQHYKDIINNLSTEHVGANANTSKLINAVIAKNTQDVKDLNLVDQVKVTNQPVEAPEQDLVPLDELNQEQWEEQVLGKQNEEKVTT